MKKCVRAVLMDSEEGKLKDDERLRQSVQCHGGDVYFTFTVAVFEGVSCWLLGEWQ